jgi:aryl-alcohol dehydrogenase-like predicted oxidoreductase
MTWGSAIDEFMADDLLKTFADEGGNLIDVSPTYGKGNAETVLGTLLSKHGARDRFILAGRGGRRVEGQAVVPGWSRTALLNQLDASLRTLGTDHLDVWQIDGPTDQTPLDEILGAAEFAVRSGRTRYVGLTNVAGWQAGYAGAWLAGRPDACPVTSIQAEYSLLNRSVETEVAPAARHLGAGILAWAPLGRGVLTGKYRGGIPADSRAADPIFEQYVDGYLHPAFQSIVDAVDRAAEGLATTGTRVALAWLLARPMVASAIVGARTVAHLREAIDVAHVNLPAPIAQALDDVSAHVVSYWGGTDD